MSCKGDEAKMASRIFQRAIGAFKSEDYHRAIQLLDQALQAVPNEPANTLKINILDSRAAAKEKINDLKGGLGDAKLVIDFAPSCPKGYIRAARLFQKIGRFSASIKMFERAIVKLSADSKKNQTTIERLQNELKEARVQDLNCRTAAGSSSGQLYPPAPSKPKYDICGILPFEIFITILTFVDPSTRFRCMAVCQSWRKAILNTPSLWTALSLTSQNHHKLMTKTKFWLARLGSNHRLQTLTIKVRPVWPPSTTHNLLTILSGKSTSTHLPSAGLRSFSFQMGGASHAIGELQRIFSDVLAFAHLNCVELGTLELQMPAFISCPVPLHVFLAEFPRLKQLKLQGERGQFLLLKKSDDFFRTPFSLSKTAYTGSTASLNNLPNSAPSQPAPVDSGDRGQYANSFEPDLETLFLQCASFTPGTDGPKKMASLRSVSLISTVINAISDGQELVANSNQYVPGIDLTCLQRLENLELCRVAVGQAQWEPVWRSCDRLPSLKRLRLEGLPHFIPHFLDLANVPEDWSPEGHPDQPFKVDTCDILPEIECICLSSLDSEMCYEFLAVFASQFQNLNTLSVVGLSLDSRTEPMLINALRNLPSLINLNLTNTYATSATIDAIKPEKLQHVQLANCIWVNFSSLSRLMTHQLVYLDITGCHLISTREMIEWLAQRVDCLVWQTGKTSSSKAVKRLFLD